MKSLVKILSVLATCLMYTNSVNAAVVAGYTFDDNAFVDTLVSHNGDFLNYTSATASDIISTAQLTADLTDGPDNGQNTYVLSLDPAASVELAFSSTDVYNGDGDDLALFFVGIDSTFSMRLSGVTNTYTAIDTGYDVTDSFGTYALTLAVVNLDDFGMTTNDYLGNFEVLLGDAGHPALSMVAAFNTGVAPIPLPAPLLLLISGLAALGLLGRRRR